MHTKSDTTRIMAKASPNVVLVETTLTLKGNLQRADFAAFEHACQTLVKSAHCKVVLDMSACTYVSSLVIGILVDAVTQMRADGKDVKVRVSPEVGRFLHMAHLYHLFSYEIVEPNLG
ncbi:MAG TPA: STAS domain-containing protein [Planctomycetota bacterium]|nr:STAS domain-containing protein [Planctomycetota bacterium]